MPVADPLHVAMRMANKLADDLPRNLDAAILRHAVRQLVTATPQPTPKPMPKRRRRIVRPGYWAERKRAQRARIRAAKAATGRRPDMPDASE
jgi:hypothetical protein